MSAWDAAASFLWGNTRRQFWTACLLIVAAVFYAYAPARQHPPRGDQWAYLINTRKADSWWELVSRYYSYTRTMELVPGEQGRFKPLENIFLLTEKWLYGANIAYWQTTGIVLHLGSCFWMLCLLWKISPGLPAFFFVLWFSTLHSCQEMVVWHNINGYSLFVNFLLAAIYFAYTCATEPSGKTARLLGALLFAGLAGFTAELGILLCLILGIYLSTSLGAGHRWKGGLFLLPVLLFFAANQADLRMRGLTPDPNDVPTFPKDPLATLSSIGTLLKWTFLNSLFPSQFHLSYKRMHMPMVDFSDILGNFENRLWTVSVLMIAGCFLATHDLRRGLRALQSKLPFLAALTLILMANCYGIAVGRMQPRGDSVIVTNTHYCYFIMVLTVPLLFLLASAAPATVSSKTFRLLLAIAALLVVDKNVHHVRAANLSLQRAWKPSLRYWRELNAFVSRHKGEPDFSFAVDPPPLEDSFHFGLHSSTILFWKWIDGKNPKYVLNYKNRVLVIHERPRDAEEWVRPRFVSVASIGDAAWDFMVYQYQEMYYGVAQRESPFLPEWIPNYRYLVRADAEKKVRDLACKSAERLKADSANGAFPEAPPHFLWERYNNIDKRGGPGFNIFRIGGKYWGMFFAIGQEEGEFDLAKALSGRYRRCFRADTLEEVKHWIDTMAPL